MMLNELDIWMPKLAMDLDLIMLQTWANSQSSPRHDSDPLANQIIRVPLTVSTLFV